MADTASPCTRNCCLDERDVCLGCGRSINEIMRWRDTDEADRVMMLRLAQERLAQRGEKTLATKSKFDAE